MDRFENMNTFIKVVEAGSISAAANRIGTAKSAVSRRLKELETHLGVELFHRTTRKMNLTDTGRSFYQQCLRLVDDVLEAEQSTSKAHGQLQGSLKIALPLSFGLMHLGPAINEFSKKHPQIEFDLDFSDREVDLMQEGFDLAIRIADLPDSSLIARKLAPIKTVMTASPDYLQNMGTPETIDELSQHQCLAYNLMKNFETWHFIDTQGQEISTKIRAHLKASNGEFLRDAAVAGQGIMVAPSFITYNEIQSGALIPILQEYQSLQINAYAIYPHTRHLSQRVRAFVDFLVRRFEGTPYWDKCIS